MNLIRQETFWDREQTIRLVEMPIARATDPESSHHAAAELTASGRRGQQIAQTFAAVKAFPGRTSQELSDKTGICRFVLARRLPEAVTAGAITKGLQRACSVTGKLALTWWPVEPGMKVAA
ncbi:winged helix-turn-helix domain-containing protein [Dyella sp.]|uniref:winged helix-turn-helix domain-containing protein n=1 Tax=Dyella sp. TaxID=1869338 RepID=UPI0028420134|nr:winged helix-turn-helix domain-containing protein [Dyella sp.]MDR3445965.1 winged helix-turn-helix domain-containing protein [Dyella sp.]